MTIHAVVALCVIVYVAVRAYEAIMDSGRSIPFKAVMIA